MVRHTKQRQAVLEVLRHSRVHPDAAWIHQEVRQQLPHISLGTVYRTLDALVKDGIAMTIETAGQATRYDYRHGDHHHHAVCRQCGEIFDIELDTLPKLPAGTLPQGFQAMSVQLEVHGICLECSRKQAAQSN